MEPQVWRGISRLPAQCGKLGGSCDSHGGFQGAWLHVVTRVDHGGIGPGDAGADVLRRLDDSGAEGVFHQVPGGKAAQNAAADDHNVIVHGF